MEETAGEGFAVHVYLLCICVLQVVVVVVGSCLGMALKAPCGVLVIQ